MTRQVGIAGIEPEELDSVRLLIALLRHPDPAAGELARQALDFVRDKSGITALGEARARDHAS